VELTVEEKEMLEGKQGRAVQKAMEILVTLGEIYNANKMVKVRSVQISGVSYANLGSPGLDFLRKLSEDGKVRVLTTLNPAGMDLEEWEKLGIPKDFAEKQLEVIDAFKAMGIITTATCTPYLVGNVPHYGDHVAWAESSAVAFANSVIGARTNREGGPSALAAALTGRTPMYGLHLEENRVPEVTVNFEGKLRNIFEFGVLGKAIAEKTKGKIVYIRGIEKASVDELKSFGASLATYAGIGIYHMENITPEAIKYEPPKNNLYLSQDDINSQLDSLRDENVEEIDFVTIGCPHASLEEIIKIADMLQGKKVTKEFWITTSRPIKTIADKVGLTKIIEEAGAKIAADTCCVVAPIKGRFKAMATNSAKACYYAKARNNFKVRIMSFEETVMEALK